MGIICRSSLACSWMLAVPVSALSFSGDVRADHPLDLKPQLFECRVAKINENFESQLPSVAIPVKGTWTVESGVLSGSELPEDHHAAVLNYQIANHDSAVKFRFKLIEQSSGFHFSLNHQAGHLFRIVFEPNSVSIKLDKDKKDPKSKVVNLAADSLVMADKRFEIDRWYTVLIEMQRDRVIVQSDNGVHLDVSHPKLNTDKPNYRFVTKGKSLLLDDFQIFDK